ncbi:MAG: DUF885 family protein, partial [Actinomycetota bacterium]
MSTDQLGPQQPAQRPVRDVADGYVLALADLNPILATVLGLHPGEDGMPDLSPDGQQAADALARTALTELAAVEAAGPTADGDERRCARLLRERLDGGLARSEAGDHLREVSNIFGPMQSVRSVFMSMPAATEDDWAVICRRMARVPEALAGYRASLSEGSRQAMFAAPRQVETVTGQLAEWAAAGDGRGWFADFTVGAPVPPALRADLDAAAAGA